VGVIEGARTAGNTDCKTVRFLPLGFYGCKFIGVIPTCSPGSAHTDDDLGEACAAG